MSKFITPTTGDADPALYGAATSGTWAEESGGVQRFNRAVLEKCALPLHFVFLAMSPMTVMADPWLIDRRRNNTSSCVIRYTISRKRITLREANRRAFHLLRTMEEARRHASQAESDCWFRSGLDA